MIGWFAKHPINATKIYASKEIFEIDIEYVLLTYVNSGVLADISARYETIYAWLESAQR